VRILVVLVLVVVLERIGGGEAPKRIKAPVLSALSKSAGLIGLAAWPSRGWREANKLGVKLFQMEPLVFSRLT
jgi:hypothetical protein